MKQKRIKPEAFCFNENKFIGKKTGETMKEVPVGKANGGMGWGGLNANQNFICCLQHLM